MPLKRYSLQESKELWKKVRDKTYSLLEDLTFKIANNEYDQALELFLAHNWEQGLALDRKFPVTKANQSHIDSYNRIRDSLYEHLLVKTTEEMADS